jgi:hypothetical protein
MSLLRRLIDNPPGRGSIRVETVNGRPRVYPPTELREPRLRVGVRQRVVPWKVAA